MENRKGELLVVLGVVLLFVGPMLNFYDIDAPGVSLSGSGYDADQGSTYVLAAIVALIGLAVAWMLTGGGRKAGGIVILIAGVFATYAGYVDAFTNPDDIPASVDVSHGIGTYVVTAAGVLTIIGAVLIMKGSEPAPVAPMEPPPPTA